MASVNLVQLFQALKLPISATSDNNLSAVRIPGVGDHRLAKDSNGAPCLLIRQSPTTASSVPIRLANLLIAFDVLCTIVHSQGNPERDTFTIIRCTASPALFPHFLRILSPIITALGPTPTRTAVQRVISGLVELFQALTVPGKKTIQGLWAELLLIRLSSDPLAMVAAWHRDPFEDFDFAAGPQRIEVKSSGLRRREHYFSLVQLTPPEGAQVLVASLFAERTGGGESIQQLFESIRELLAANTELTSHFDTTFYASLGSGWEEAMSEAFDLELATESLAFFAAGTVPKVGEPIPSTVSDVRFRSDLTQTTPLAQTALIAEGGLIAAAVPGRVQFPNTPHHSNRPDNT